MLVSGFIGIIRTKGIILYPRFSFLCAAKPLFQKNKACLRVSVSFSNLANRSFDNHKTKFLREVKGIASALAATGLAPQVLGQEEWFKLLFEYLNFDRTERIGTARYREPQSCLDASVSEQLTLTDCLWNKEAVVLGNYKFRTLSMATLPEGQTFAAMAQVFAAVPFHFWLSQSIHLLDQAKEKSSLELKRRIAHSMASGSKNG